jgi:hypothetical protein
MTHEDKTSGASDDLVGQMVDGALDELRRFGETFAPQVRDALTSAAGRAATSAAKETLRSRSSAAQPATATAQDPEELVRRLHLLRQLHDDGVITETEHTTAKAAVLARF